jgi:hypothetical protein
MRAISPYHVLLVITVPLFLADISVTVVAFSLPSKKRSTTRFCAIISNDKNDDKIDKGFNLLEIASAIVPQGRIVSTVKETWKFAWQRMMAELAPQDSKGRYSRPSYSFQGFIGKDRVFPDEPGRYHLYVGNPCPVGCLLCCVVLCFCLLLQLGTVLAKSASCCWILLCSGVTELDW